LALIGNYSILNKSPGRFFGGSGASQEVQMRSNFNTSGAMRNRMLVDMTTAANQNYSVPTANYPNRTWMLPNKVKFISSRYAANIAVTATANGLMGKPGSGSASFAITATNSARLPADDTSPLRTGSTSFAISATNSARLPADDTSPLRTGSASFTISTNTPSGELIAFGIGSASITFSTNTPVLTASIQGAGSASFTISAEALLGAEASAAGSASFSITATNSARLPVDDTSPLRTGESTITFTATNSARLPANDTSPLRTGTASFSFSGSLLPYAIGHMSGSTAVTTEMTPATIASEVWNSMLDEYQQTGSAGKLLSIASTGGLDIDALIEALTASPLPANMTQVRGQELTGTGTPLDPWGPA
jgi:hypothetical protein